MQGEGELDDAEARAEVPTRAGHRRHERTADLRGQRVELRPAEIPQVGRAADRTQQVHSDTAARNDSFSDAVVAITAEGS